MDTYHIQIKKINWHTVILYAFIVVLCWLLFRSCGTITPKPVIITGKQVHDTIFKIDKDAQRVRDSFAIVLNQKHKEDDANYQAYLRLLNENAVLLNQNEMLSQYVPDSCKELQAAWVIKFNQIKSASEKKDIAANKTITGLQSTVSTQKSFMDAKDADYRKMKNIADTCSKALTAMEKYAKKIKPKREINAGIEVNSSWVNLKPTIGIGIGYRDRKGLQINAAAFINQTFSIGIKKPLIKF